MSIVARDAIKTKDNASGEPIQSAQIDTALFHRSRKRIKDLGEVFTPETSIVDMLKLISRSHRGIWGNENISFFEPCCGHGNIVVVIYRKRLQALYKKALRLGYKKPAYYAVANSINTLWAIDIDPQNVAHCKSRVLSTTLEYIKGKTSVTSDQDLIAGEAEFFSHLFCSINWHIQENETLSSLSDVVKAEASASKTQTGQRWFRNNGHHPIDLETSWADYFKSNKADKIVQLNFKRSARFVRNLIEGDQHYDAQFEFADFLVHKQTAVTNLLAQNNVFATGGLYEQRS